MGSPSNKISTCLFFGDCAEEAANFYVSIFPDAKIDQIARSPEVAQEHQVIKPGNVLLVSFTLNGRSFTALNSRPPTIQMSEAVSVQIECETQEEIDHYWGRLSEGGDESKQMCGWLQDKFGLSWQVFPNFVPEIMAGGDARKAAKCMVAFSSMKKIILQDIIHAINEEN